MIPLGSDVDFDIEVVECNRTPDFTEQVAQPVTTTMQPGRCMYLHSVASNEEETPLVLTCEDEDRIAESDFHTYPSVPCYLEEWVKENKNQQFHYVEGSGVVKDFAKEWELCVQNGKLQLCDYSQVNVHTISSGFNTGHFSWLYDGVSETLNHETAYGSQFPYVDHTVKWAPVLIDTHTHQDAVPQSNINAKFRIEYCWKNF